MKKDLYRYILILWLGVFMHSSPAAVAQEITFGVIPYVSPSSLVEFQSPLKQYIERTLGKPVNLVSAKDFDSFVERTHKGEYDILFTAPHFGRLAQKREGYIPLAMTSHNVQGLFLAKIDSPIQSLDDLKDKKIMIAQRTSILFQLAVQTLKQKGLIEGKNITIIDTRTHNNALYAPMRDEADASVTGVLLWHTLGQEYKEKMHVIGSTPKVPGFFILAHPRLPAETRQKLKSALLKFPQSPEGITYFNATGFIGMQELSETVMKDMDPYTDILMKNP